MNNKEKIEWLRNWCKQEKLKLVLRGECGFARECVGVSSKNDGTYPDYTWHDEDYTKRIDNNGDVWAPQNAYHKHPCTAVLGRGEPAISQLYDWCKWFSDNNFHYKKVKTECNDDLSLALGFAYHHIMEKAKYTE